MMRGTPAMTMTFSSMKPGALEMALSISAAPLGMRAMRSRAGVSSSIAEMLAHGGDGGGIDIDLDPEGHGDGVGGDIVMGRADAAGSKYVSILLAERVHRGGDLGLAIGHDPDLAQRNSDPRQIGGDVGDVLVLGAARQDLLANHEERGRDGLVVLLRASWRKKTLAATRSPEARRLPRPARRAFAMVFVRPCERRPVAHCGISP